MSTKVIFRKFRDNGEIIALFPDMPGTMDPWTCSCYMHLGQHGTAGPGIIKDTVPASPGEYGELFDELVYIGYDDLKVMKRVNNSASYQARYNEIRRGRG